MTKFVGCCLFTIGTGMLTAWSCAHPAAPTRSALVRPTAITVSPADPQS